MRGEKIEVLSSCKGLIQSTVTELACLMIGLEDGNRLDRHWSKEKFTSCFVVLWPHLALKGHFLPVFEVLDWIYLAMKAHERISLNKD